MNFWSSDHEDASVVRSHVRSEQELAALFSDEGLPEVDRLLQLLKRGHPEQRLTALLSLARAIAQAPEHGAVGVGSGAAVARLLSTSGARAAGGAPAAPPGQPTPPAVAALDKLLPQLQPLFADPCTQPIEEVRAALGALGDVGGARALPAAAVSGKVIPLLLRVLECMPGLKKSAMVRDAAAPAGGAPRGAGGVNAVDAKAGGGGGCSCGMSAGCCGASSGSGSGSSGGGGAVDVGGVSSGGGGSSGAVSAATAGGGGSGGSGSSGSFSPLASPGAPPLPTLPPELATAALLAVLQCVSGGGCTPECARRSIVPLALSLAAAGAPARVSACQLFSSLVVNGCVAPEEAAPLFFGRLLVLCQDMDPRVRRCMGHLLEPLIMFLCKVGGVGVGSAEAASLLEKCFAELLELLSDEHEWVRCAALETAVTLYGKGAEAGFSVSALNATASGGGRGGGTAAAAAAAGHFTNSACKCTTHCCGVSTPSCGRCCLLSGGEELRWVRRRGALLLPRLILLHQRPRWAWGLAAGVGAAGGLARAMDSTYAMYFCAIFLGFLRKG